MVVEVTKKRFSVDEYCRRAEAGIFRAADRFELMDGEIIPTSPIGHGHAVGVRRATTFFTQASGNRRASSPQLPLPLTDRPEPKPGIVVFKPRSDFYPNY